MGLLLGLAPLAIYFVLAPLSLSLGLWLAFAAAFSLGIRFFIQTGTVRPLDGAGIMLFGLLALYDAFVDRGATATRTGMIVEAGLFGTALWSLWVRRPFTEQYLPPGNGNSWRTNVLLTSVWTVTFAAMACANAIAIFLPVVSPPLSAGAGLVVFAGALTFTWYATVQKRAAEAPAFRRR